MSAPTSSRSVTAGRVPVALAAWSLWYGSYRAYDAAGGRVGMIGVPVSTAQFRAMNAVGAAVILSAAVLPLVAVHQRRLRQALPLVAWIGAVGCCMHGAVDVTLRLLSVTGVHPTQLPASVWDSFDRHTADLQDLLLNEPWFLIEGVLWAALGAMFVNRVRRRAWLLSACCAGVVLTVIGVLSGLNVIGSFHVG